MEWRFNGTDQDAMRRVKSECLLRLHERWPAMDLWPAEVIFGELVGNAVRHVGGEVQVSLRDRTGRPALSVRDADAVIPHVRRDDKALTEHGRGFGLISAFANRILIKPDAHGKEIVAELPT